MLGWIRNIGLSWKVQLAPAFLILVLIGVGAYALQALRSNQTAVDALVRARSGNPNWPTISPPRPGWRMPSCIAWRRPQPTKRTRRRSQAFAKETSAAAAKIPEALKAVRMPRAGQIGGLEKLKTAVAGYLKQSKNAIEMADGDAGSALMFIKGAERNFADIEKLTDDLIARSSDSKDREIARAGMRLEQQQLTLMIALLVVAFAGVVVSFLIGRSISRPVVAMSSAMRELAAGNFEVRCRASTHVTRSGRWRTRSQEFKVQAVAKAERETAEREEKNLAVATARRAELQNLAESFETTVGNIIENVGTASSDWKGLPSC